LKALEELAGVQILLTDTSILVKLMNALHCLLTFLARLSQTVLVITSKIYNHDRSASLTQIAGERTHIISSRRDYSSVVVDRTNAARTLFR
jgi:hypothetical protein